MKIKNENGFTLIELMVVLVIIIVVIGLGIAMYFANLPHIRLTSATRGFKDDLIRAQSIAARENARVRVTFTTNGSYEVVRIVGDQDPLCAPLITDINIKTVDLVNQYRNTVSVGTFTACGAQTVVFGRLGAVDNITFTPAIEAPVDYCNGEFRVNIQRADGSETMRVCINNAGRIRMP